MVVTLLPTFYWDCCYRSPQARFTYAFLRPIRNFVWSLGRLGARTMSEYTSTNYLGIWARALQYPFVILSLGKTYVPWRVQEQDHLRRLSDELDVKIAMTAWYTTLDPVYLDHMRIAFCGEPDAPLADCLSGLVSEAHDDIDWPALLSKRNAGRRLTRMVLIALRQMLTIQRADRDRFRPPWENTVQQLINLYKNAASLWGGDRIPHDEATLRTAFFVLMEANSGSNRYAALEFLSSAVNVDSSPSCDYLTVSRVLSAAGQWIKRTPVEGGGDEEDEELQAEHSPPEINMTAFCVVVHCMLRIIEGKTNMPPPLPAVRFERLCQRASEALSQLPSFLPMGQALLAGPRGNKSLCNKLAFGLQMLLPLLTRLSRCTKTKPDDLDVPELICVEVITALWNVWETARTVLDPNMNPEPLAAAQGITQKLEVVEASVAVLFQPSYNSLLAPLRDY
ncbi:hypothetical protein FKP32DRAFT_1562408 [Trametes sanguinea]|nr:hypothetical protein FKP32DRAFT_1562408 [Trametes sanguinea]